jgi:hypothetical protein
VAADAHAATRRLGERDGIHPQAGTALVGMHRGKREDGRQCRHERHRPSALGADQNGRTVFRCTDHRRNARRGRAQYAHASGSHLGATTGVYRKLAGYSIEPLRNHRSNCSVTPLRLRIASNNRWRTALASSNESWVSQGSTHPTRCFFKTDRLKERRMCVTDFPTTRAKQTGRRPGRNQLCPCGSGRKYKRCHGSNE